MGFSLTIANSVDVRIRAPPRRSIPCPRRRPGRSSGSLREMLSLRCNPLTLTRGLLCEVVSPVAGRGFLHLLRSPPPWMYPFDGGSQWLTVPNPPLVQGHWSPNDRKRGVVGKALAPVFRPSATEFADPMAYISKIRPGGRNFLRCNLQTLSTIHQNDPFVKFSFFKIAEWCPCNVSPGMKAIV